MPNMIVSTHVDSRDRLSKKFGVDDVAVLEEAAASAEAAIDEPDSAYELNSPPSGFDGNVHWSLYIEMAIAKCSGTQKRSHCEAVTGNAVS